MNIAIYARVSTDRQGESITAQRSICRELIEAKFKSKSYQIIEYVDEGKSGKDIKHRPQMLKLQDDIRTKRVSVVVFSRLDRAFRNMRQALDFISLCNDFGCEFISKKENFDTTSAAGKAMLNISLVFSQMEREMVSERLLAHNAIRRKEGKKACGSIAYGYIRDKDKNLAIDKPAAKVIKLIFTKYLELGSLSAVRNYLNTNGYTFTKGLAFRQDKHTAWRANTIGQILKNKTYIGYVEYNTHNRSKKDGKYEVVGKGNWEAIIDNDIFENVQKLLANNATKRKNSIINPKQIIPFVYSDVMFCKCGRHMVGTSSRHRNKDKSIKQYYSYYKCPTCKTLIAGNWLDTQIDEVMTEIMSNKKLLIDAIDESRVIREKRVAEIEEARKNQEAKLIKLEERKKELITALGNTKIQAVLDEINAELTSLLGSIRMQKDVISGTHDEEQDAYFDEYDADKLKKTVSGVKNFKALDPDRKREIVSQLIKQIRAISKEEIEISFLYGEQPSCDGCSPYKQIVVCNTENQIKIKVG